MRAFSNLVNVGGPMDMFFSNSISRGSCGVSASTTSRSWMTLIFFSSSACCSSVSVPPLSISLRYIVRDFARPESIVEVFASSLSSCTTVAHKHNKSQFYDRFKEIVKKLGFDKMELKADVSEAADTVMTDRGHLDPNPIPISKQDVVKCLEDIKQGNL